MATQQLDLFTGDAAAYGMLCPDTGPAVVGAGSIDWQCGQCGTRLLAGMYDRQVLDLLVRCPACSVIVATPTREPGEPLAGHPVVAPPGRYRLSSPIRNANPPVMLAGVQAVQGYQEETGLTPATTAALYLQAPTEFSAAYLRTLAADATALLGDRAAHLQAADARGKASPTPPVHRHRLIELIDTVETIAADFDHGDTVAVDGDGLSELSTCVSLFQRWQRHPAAPYLRQTLADGVEVQHTVMTLGVASYLADARNPVGIMFRQSGARIPDVWVTPSLTERLNLEVKTPVALRGPRAAVLTPADAERLLAQQLKKAAATGRGQLDQRQAGILAVGGFHLGSSFPVLVHAATRTLSTQATRKPHLAALLLMNLTYHTTPVGSVDMRAGPTTMFQPVLQAELVRHPGYRGSLAIHDHGAPWTTLEHQ